MAVEAQTLLKARTVSLAACTPLPSATWPLVHKRPCPSLCVGSKQHSGSLQGP